MSKAPKNGRKKDETKPDITPLQAVVELARRGERAILPRLRKILDEHPELVKQYGNLARRAQQAWLDLYGKNLFAQETAARQLESLREELAESKASPLEKLVIERLVAVWRQMLYFDSREALGKGLESTDLAEFHRKRQEQAHKQLLSAVKALAELRKVTPPVVVIQVAADQDSAGEAANGGMNGTTGNSEAKPRPTVSRRPTRANGHNHNRLAALLGAGETLGVG